MSFLVYAHLEADLLLFLIVICFQREYGVVRLLLPTIGAIMTEEKAALSYLSALGPCPQFENLLMSNDPEVS